MKKLSRKRFIKLCMSSGYSRNEASNLAYRATAFANWSQVPDYTAYYMGFVLSGKENIPLREFLRGCELLTSLMDAGYCDKAYAERWLENMIVRTSRGRIVLPTVPVRWNVEYPIWAQESGCLIPDFPVRCHIDPDYEVRAACVKMRSMTDEFGYLRIDKESVRERAIDQMLHFIAPCIEFEEKPCGSFTELTARMMVLVKKEEADNE